MQISIPLSRSFVPGYNLPSLRSFLCPPPRPHLLSPKPAAPPSSSFWSPSSSIFWHSASSLPFPQPHHPFRRRQHRPRRRHHRLFRFRLGAHAVHFFAHPRRVVRPFRPPPGHPHLLLRTRPRLHLHGPRAFPQMAPGRTHHLRNHRLQHLHRLRLRHRRHASRKPRQAVRLPRCLLWHGLHHRPGRRRIPRQH